MAQKTSGVPGLALIDYDHFRKSWFGAQADEQECAEGMLDTVARSFDAAFPGVTELDVRLYSGWVDEHGNDSQRASTLSSILPVLTGRRQGIIVRPRLAKRMMAFPELTLRGTVRVREGRGRRESKLEQKMVDGMIGCDAMFAVADGSVRVALVAADDDFVPAALSAHAANTDLFAWLRRESSHPRPNDDALLCQGIRLRPITIRHCP